ncbi:MAG: tail fiber domain-containing protein [Acidovorax sp.]|nr:tail fiber domain-containing protein [Acidovorax sp.]
MDILRFKQKALGHVLRCQDAPDTSGQQQAALQTAQLSREQLEWAKQIYEQERPQREAAAARANAVSDAQLASMRQNDAIAKDYYDYQVGTFRPLEKRLVAEAESYDTPERRAAEAAAAKADVTMAVDATQAATLRGQQRMGVNPNSGKVMALQNQMALGKAALLAGADSAARRNVETQGYARRMDAANLGRGLASNQATSAGVALSAGNASAANALSSLTPGNQANAQMAAGYQNAIAGQGQAASIYGDIARTQASSGNSGLWGALGSVAGGALANPAMRISDRDQKRDIQPASTDKALKAVVDTPVALWRYKDASPANDGGQEHIGPMAQDLQRTAGDTVAPGGKQIDLGDATGLLMAAIQGLDKKVARVESMAAKHGAGTKTSTAK